MGVCESVLFFCPAVKPDYRPSVRPDVGLSGRLMSVHLAVTRDSNFNVEHYLQTSQSNSFILVVLKGITDLYHFTPLSLAIASAEGHKVGRKLNQSCSFSRSFFFFFFN